MLLIARAHRDRLLHGLSALLRLQQVAALNDSQHTLGTASFVATQTSVQRPQSASTAVAAAVAATSATTGTCQSLHSVTAWPWSLTFRPYHTDRSRQSSNDVARQLTVRIKVATSAHQLLLLIRQHGAVIDHIHVSALYTRAKALFGGGGRKLQEPAVQQLLQQMEQLVEQVQQQCTAREFANIIWSCGYLSRPGVVSLLLPCLLQPHVLQQAEAQHLSNTLLGVAKSGAALAPDQLQQLLSAFSRQLAGAKPQAISNILWAVATMGQQVPAKQLQQLLSAFSQQLADAMPQNISNTLWAVAIMGQQVPAEQLQQLLSAFSILIADTKPQEISNTLWAVATIGQQMSVDQLQGFCEAFTNKLGAANMQELANTLWACGEQQYAPLQLLAALEQRQPYLQQQFTTTAPMHLSGIAYACGQLGYCSKLLPGALLQAAADRCRREGAKAFGTQALSNLCWSAAVLDQQQYAPQVLELAAACGTVWHTVQAEDLRQLYQVHLWLPESQVSGGLSGVLTPQQLQQCRKEWELQLAAVAKASKLQQQVLAALQQLPPGTLQQQPVMEQRTADGAFSIDIAVTTAAGCQVAIEVDGPSHFLRPDNTVDGPTCSRNRALHVRGWHVVSAPYFEWNKLRPGQQQQAYLLAKLQAACTTGGDAAASC